jgi:hypothetical protein
MPYSLMETAIRKLQIENADAMRLAIQQEIERSDESRYDHRLHGVLRVVRVAVRLRMCSAKISARFSAGSGALSYMGLTACGKVNGLAGLAACRNPSVSL